VDQEVDDLEHDEEENGTDANDENAAYDLCFLKRVV